MRSRSSAALGVALLLLGGVNAQAGERYGYHRHHRLPPVSGTLQVDPSEFGQARYGSPANGPEVVEVVRGGVYPQASTYPVGRWETGGTGVSGIVGNTGNPYFGQTRWGTADSATSGPGLAPRTGWQRRGLFTQEPSLAERYGEAPIYGDPTYGEGGSYGATPQLPFYGSGAPYSLSYYSSGSSAGPYGSPGGLGTYRSGSYGYGPRVIETAAYGAENGFNRQGCTCGPGIVHLRRHHRYYSER